MLLLHLPPLNADNVPWRVEYLEFDPEMVTKYNVVSAFRALPRARTICVRPRAGEYPSPRYALASPYDTGDTLMFGTTNNENASAELKTLLSRHQDIVFTGERALALMRALELRLLTKELLTGKNVVIIKNLVQAAHLFKNAWAGLKPDIRGLAMAIWARDLSLAASEAPNDALSNTASNINNSVQANNSNNGISISGNNGNGNVNSNVNKNSHGNSAHSATLNLNLKAELKTELATKDYRDPKTSPLTVLECATIVLLDLWKHFKALTSYYLKPAFPFTNQSLPPKTKPSLWLALKEQEMRLIVPLRNIGNKIYAADIGAFTDDSNILDSACMLIDDHTWIMSPAPVITNNILNSLSLDAEVAQSRLEVISKLINDEARLVEYFDEALARNPEETAITAPLSNYKAMNLRAAMRLEHHTYQTISNCHGDVGELTKMLPALKGVYRLMVMDYLAGVSPEYLNEPYRTGWLEAARSRELYGREMFTKEMNQINGLNLTTRQQNVIKRLLNAVENLMNG